MIPVSLSVAIDVAPVYPEDSDHSSSVKTITPSSVLTLTDITVPGADDQVTHFVSVSPEDPGKNLSSEASHARKSAHSDFEERIRQRLQKEKQKLALKELALKSSSSRGKSRSYKLAESSEPERSSRFDSSFRDRSRSRYHHKTRDSVYTNKDSSYSSTSSRFKPSRTSYSTRNRFKSVITDRIDVVKPALLKPSISKPRYATSTRSEIPELTFKKFERPNVKKNFLNKYFPRPNILKNQNTEEREDGPLNIENEEIRFERLLTTLDVSTSYPEELTEQYLEVATIRSPYTFNIEDNEKSTRFITITKSLTKTMEISPSKSFTSTPSSSIHPSPSLSSTPLFDTNSIPPPENILATSSTPYDNIDIQGSSDVEFLAPITLTSSLHEATPPLKTVTETLSTVETLVKNSVLPVIIGEDLTSLFTLSQTYSITRIVTAVKTVPPMDLFEFNPQQSFADFDTLFEGAGSENRESLLPGELEFSDQDNFGLEGPSIVKVAPPHEFLDDLDIIGTKFDFVDQMEKHNNPDLLQLKGSAPSLESSLTGGAGPEEVTARPALSTPGLPDNGLSALGITPEQLLYLQLLQNPLAALGLGGLQPQVKRNDSF